MIGKEEHVAFLAGIPEALEGRLSPEGRRRWDAHRDACPDCAGVLAGWDPGAPVPDLARAVRDALRPARRRDETRRLAFALATAALAFGLAAAAFWRPERPWLEADRSFT